MERNIKTWTTKEIKFLLENHKNMTYFQMADKLGRTIPSIKGKCRILEIECVKETKDSFYYYLYHGDEIRARGTVKEIAKQLNLQPETVKFYSRPSAKKRCNNVLIKVGYATEIEEENNELNKVI